MPETKLQNSFPHSFEMVVARFAPSPTGFLHIGNARTALFNWLFARHHGGKVLLRIEDTDRERSTKEAVEVIFESLKWLELDFDDTPVFQFARQDRHKQVAFDLLNNSKAYKCYCTQEELEKARIDAVNKGESPKYSGICRHLKDSGKEFVIRLKADADGETVLHDKIQGEVRVKNKQLDDMVLLRADLTPTYMLSVVVDDHDMGISHVIRGVDHLTNTFRQIQLYRACGWEEPTFAHIPLIHGADGTKLSKRHGALSTTHYKEMGILPEAMRNYLLRLGWAHGDDEIISTEQAIEWFDLDAVGKSPSRFDLNKLLSLNAAYLRKTPNEQLLERLFPTDEAFKERLLRGLDSLKTRARTLNDLKESSQFYKSAKQPKDDKALALCTKESARIVNLVITTLKEVEAFTAIEIENCLRTSPSFQGLKLQDIASPLRVALTGSTISPSLFEIMEILGREEVLRRLESFEDFAG